MNLSLVPYRAWHLDFLQARGAAEGGGYVFNEAQMKALEAYDSWTVMGDVPIAAGGMIQIWPGRHSTWAYIGKDAAPHMLFITREAKRGFDRTKGRIEMTVQHDFMPGRRWAQILGLQCETPRLRAYGPDGKDHVSYVRFN